VNDIKIDTTVNNELPSVHTSRDLHPLRRKLMSESNMYDLF